ncbi:MAG TPA: Uma2 family endonuclease [Blastocatellia bacterium]|nr:Uma2 family endonuclease [Blastocatellia bacterium]
MQPVSTSPLVRKYSLKEFWALPEPQDGTKLELIAGVLYMSPPPDFPHNLSSASLSRLFILHLSQIGDQGIVFTPRAAIWKTPATYIEPDLFYISARTAREIDLRKPDRADLVVEIISPGTVLYDRNTKADTYSALGVRELWLVDPVNETVEIRNLKRGSKTYSPGTIFRRGDQVKSRVLPGFSPSVTDICKHSVPRKH